MSVYEELTETQQFACRVIADHARSTAFSIADGILPGNEGRNYVLRKIMRRAIYHGREHLGFRDLFFYKVCDFVIGEMHEAYPELEVQREFVGKMVRVEEERFGNTLTVGLKKLNEIVANAKEARSKADLTVPIKNNPNARLVSIRVSKPTSESIAQLNDTFGLPIDLAYVVLSQNEVVLQDKVTIDGLTSYQETNVGNISEDEFRDLIAQAVKKLQHGTEIGKTKQSERINPIYIALERTSIRSNFHGYDSTHIEDTEVVALVKDDKRVEELIEGDEGLIVLNDTPFYAEAGGQVGDTGFFVRTGSGSDLVIKKPPANAGGSDLSAGSEDVAYSRVKVLDTFAPVAGIILHKSKVEKGSIKVGDKVAATVDAEKRDATRRNHTATHLVHAALREVLGTHVKQAGSVVAPNYLRFDFTHYQPISESELIEIENLVNRYILQNEPVTTNIMAIEEAMHGGAMALFGEKYGSDVRVLSIGEGVFSKELCGGTHVRATGDIGSFKVTSDEAIASGVRRIRAITGFDAFERFREDEKLIDKSLGALKTQRDNLPSAIERLQEELKRTRKENDDLKLKIATGSIGTASSNGDEARDVAGIQVLGKIVEGLDGNGTRQLSDTLLTRLKSGVVVLGRTDDGKVSIIVRVSNDLTDKIQAGSIIKEIAPIIGGRGGGKSDMAEGGGSEPDKLQEAIEASYGVIDKMLSGA
ncbi:MAG: alanine--tRNA ligase-related protein [Pyrinomonadaceae bacterium]